MSAVIVKNLKDCSHVKIVPVIASFHTDGKISPLYVRVEGVSLKIHSFWSKPFGLNIVEFECKVEDGECLKLLKLSYYKNEMLWTIPTPS